MRRPRVQLDISNEDDNIFNLVLLARREYINKGREDIADKLSRETLSAPTVLIGLDNLARYVDFIY